MLKVYAQNDMKTSVSCSACSDKTFVCQIFFHGFQTRSPSEDSTYLVDILVTIQNSINFTVGLLPVFIKIPIIAESVEFS